MTKRVCYGSRGFGKSEFNHRAALAAIAAPK